MPRLAIDLPPELGCGDVRPDGEGTARRTDDRPRGEPPDAESATAAAEERTRRFVRWVACWAGAGS